MNVEAYIRSGILENFCLGFCSAEENRDVEEMASQYPEIKAELEKIRSSLEEYFLANEIKPAPSVKIAVMLSIYKQMAASQSEYPPFIEGALQTQAISEWLSKSSLPAPKADFENLFFIELPSTEQVANFIVYAKNGHKEEVHTDLIEYLYVIQGSCVMDFDGRKRSYSAGEIISIMPHVRHHAVVTSDEPMIALVQRQACA